MELPGETHVKSAAKVQATTSGERIGSDVTQHIRHISIGIIMQVLVISAFSFPRKYTFLVGWSYDSAAAAICQVVFIFFSRRSPDFAFSFFFHFCS